MSFWTANISSTGDATHKTWKAENNMVMFWLINSMANESEKTSFFIPVQVIWDAAREAFSNTENTAQLFAVKSALQDQKQGNLTCHWQQLDLIEVHAWKCPTDKANTGKLLKPSKYSNFFMAFINP